MPSPRKPCTRTEPLDVEQARLLVDTAIMMSDRQGLSVLCGLYLATRASPATGTRCPNIRSSLSSWHVLAGTGRSVPPACDSTGEIIPAADTS